MFCSKCGKEIHDEAVICSYCGCSTGKKVILSYVHNEDDIISVWLIVASILVPIAGVLLGIASFYKNKVKSGIAYILVGIVARIVFASIASMFFLY